MDERLGAKGAGCVPKKTDIVVAGPGAVSKLNKAKAFDVQVMDEDGWFALVGRGWDSCPRQGVPPVSWYHHDGDCP